ncbi:hypothetical protein OUZ56_000889 [Daphnia magna]|uniref:Uncharacterized protein n=1 Tax=Daphnia magna TaxID=35525 RepID=A0ABR0A1P5_9CRUS|nr:hypothetical protein OUZ56_000889 [Daphnia magna]
MRETDENNHRGMRVLKTDVKEKGQQKCGSTHQQIQVAVSPEKSQSTRRQVACLDGYINNQTVTRAAALFSPSITSSSPPPNANDIFLFYPLCLSLTRVS